MSTDEEKTKGGVEVQTHCGNHFFPEGHGFDVDENPQGGLWVLNDELDPFAYFPKDSVAYARVYDSHAEDEDEDDNYKYEEEQHAR